MADPKKISGLPPASSVNTSDYTVLVDGVTVQNKRATIAQIMAVAGGGTVTSVNASGTQGVSVAGGPVTSSGSLSIGLGAITPASVAASGTVTGSNLSGTNTGDQTIQLLGDVEAAGGTGNLTTVIATGAVTNAKLANMTGPTVKGRTSGNGTPSDVTMAQLNGMLPAFVPDSGTGGTNGLVPAPAAGDAAQKKFLRADGAWATTDLNDLLPTQTSNAGKVLSTTGTTTQWVAAPGVGTVTSVNVAGDGHITASGGPVTAAGTISVALSNTAVTPATYGSASAVPILSVDEKGRITSASTASLGTLATQNATSVTVSGGTINSTAIGATTPSTGAFTTLSSSSTTTLNGTTIPASSTLLTSGGALGTPSSATLTNATGLPVSTGISGLGTGVATALAVNVGSSGAPVVNGGALGTPSSGTVTNLTGTASININGTVGATTPSTGAFTSLSATTSALVSNNGDTSSANYPSTSTRLGGSFDGPNIMTMLSYGANTAMVQGVAGGTKASPTQTTSGSLLMILGGYGYNTTNGWGGGSGTSNARMTFAATENHTNTAQGAKISFDVTPNGTTSRVTSFALEQSGTATIGVGSTTGFNIVLKEYTTGTVRNWGIRDDAGVNRLRFARGGTDYAFWDVVKTAAADSVDYNIWAAEGSHSWKIGGTQIAEINANDLYIASGKGLRLGNAYVAGAPTATGYVVIKDSTGTSYKIPAVAV
jgi:hypothetical protein